MKIYRGIRGRTGALVYVDGELLPLLPSLRLRNHSPTGFEWGYGGSGPSQLALAMLLDCLKDEALVLRLYQDFKDEFIVELFYGGFIILESQIWAWVNSQLDNKNE